MSDRSDTVSSPGILGSMSNEISREASWVFAQDNLGRWLLHLPSGVVGKVGKVYAPGEYGAGLKPLTSLEGFRDMPGPLYEPIPGGYSISVAVLGFEDGNAFLADPKNFQVLTESDVQTYSDAVVMVRTACEQTARMGARRAMVEGQETSPIVSLIRAALQAQVRALDPR